MKNLFRQGDYVGAYNYCKANPSPVTNVVRVGVSYLGDGQNMTETAMSEELAKENSIVQTQAELPVGHRGLHADDRAARHGHGHDERVLDPGPIRHRRPEQLAGAIGEVLIATASGLFIAIPAFGVLLLPAQPRGGRRCTSSRTR